MVATHTATYAYAGRVLTNSDAVRHAYSVEGSSEQAWYAKRLGTTPIGALFTIEVEEHGEGRTTVGPDTIALTGDRHSQAGAWVLRDRQTATEKQMLSNAAKGTSEAFDEMMQPLRDALVGYRTRDQRAAFVASVIDDLYRQ